MSQKTAAISQENTATVGTATPRTTTLMLTAPASELPGLAERLARELAVMGAYKYREAQAGNLESGAEQAREAPAKSLQWRQLSALADEDPAAGLAKWGEVKEAARLELTSGGRAWEAIEPPHSTPMDRARFLVLRGELVRDWQPSGMSEALMIDQIAQALSMQFYWTEKMTQRSHAQAARDLRHREKWSAQEQVLTWGEWIPERVSEKEMIEEAQANVERWNRLYIRLVRTLRDWRRHRVTIVSAGQVNIADKQVNISDKQVNTATAHKPPAKKRRARTLRLAG